MSAGTLPAAAPPPSPRRFRIWAASGGERRLVVIALVDALGSGTFMPASVVLFTVQLGRWVGLGLVLLVAGVCTVPVARWAQREAAGVEDARVPVPA